MPQFDPKLVIVTLDGVPLNTGAADGTWITAERRNDSVMLEVGSTGESYASVNQDKSGEVTLTLMGSAQANDFLSQKVKSYELPFGILPSVLQIKDLYSRTVLFSDDAYVSKLPSVGYGKTAGDNNREWHFVCGNLSFFVGGSNI